MEKSEKFKRTFEKFTKALEKFNEIVEPLDKFKSLDQELLIEITTKRFEYTFESMWNNLQEYFRQQGIICSTPLKCFQEAFKAGLIAQEHESLFFEMIEKRNQIVHVYDLNKAKKIFDFIGQENVILAIKTVYEKLRKEK